MLLNIQLREERFRIGETLVERFSEEAEDVFRLGDIKQRLWYPAAGVEALDRRFGMHRSVAETMAEGSEMDRARVIIDNRTEVIELEQRFAVDMPRK